MDDAPATLLDPLYAMVGFGVLGVQQAQVQRRRIRRELVRLAADVEHRVDPVLDDIEASLPDELRPLLALARSTARTLWRVLLA